MTIKLSDVCRRIDNLEEGMDNIQKTLNAMREDQIRREVQEGQKRSFLRWIFPEGGSVVVLILALYTVIMQLLRN